MTDQPAEQSVLVNGRVDTSKAVSADAASGRGARPQMRDAGPATPTDPTQDPDWARFEEVHRDTVIPPSHGLSEVERYLESQAPPEARQAMPRIGGHPAPQGAGPANATLPGDIKPAAQPAATQTNQPTPQDADQRTRAIAALKRDGWKDTTISKLPDTDLLEIGLARATSQDEVDAKFTDFRTRLSEGAKPAKATTPQNGEEGATPASGSPGQTAPPTLDRAAKDAAGAVAKTFTDQWGEDVGGPVGVAIESSLKTFAAPLVAENQRLLGGLEAVAGLVEGLVKENVRQGWSQDYPQTSDPKVSAAIDKAYQTLIATGNYQMSVDGMREALEHARRIALPGVPPARVQAQRASETAQYERDANQQPVVGARAPAANGSRSEDAEMWGKFEDAHRLSDSAMRALTGGVQ